MEFLLHLCYGPRTFSGQVPCSASPPRGCTRVCPEVGAAAAAAAIQSDPTFEGGNISNLLSDPSLHKKMAVEDAAAKDVPPIPEEEGAGEVTAGSEDGDGDNVSGGGEGGGAEEESPAEGNAIQDAGKISGCMVHRTTQCTLFVLYCIEYFIVLSVRLVRSGGRALRSTAASAAAAARSLAGVFAVFKRGRGGGRRGASAAGGSGARR